MYTMKEALSYSKSRACSLAPKLHTLARLSMMTLGIADVLPSSDKGSDISCNLLANKALSTQLYGVFFFVRGNLQTMRSTGRGMCR
jgi:hypothetical protein